MHKEDGNTSPLEPLPDEDCWHYEDGKHRPCTQGCTDEKGHPDVPHCAGCAEDLSEPLSEKQNICRACNGKGVEADYVGLEMWCVEAQCSSCGGTGLAVDPKVWAAVAPNAAASLSPAAPRKVCGGTRDGRCMAEMNDEIDCGAPDCLVQPAATEGGAKPSADFLPDGSRKCPLCKIHGIEDHGDREVCSASWCNYFKMKVAPLVQPSEEGR